MANFKISFSADPDTGGPWQGRKSSRQKMIQSITDYLTMRCECSDVVLMEVIDTPAEQASPVAKKKLGSRR
jgi:hypothetical protein